MNLHHPPQIYSLIRNLRLLDNGYHTIASKAKMHRVNVNKKNANSLQ